MISRTLFVRKVDKNCVYSCEIIRQRQKNELSKWTIDTKKLAKCKRVVDARTKPSDARSLDPATDSQPVIGCGVTHGA